MLGLGGVEEMSKLPGIVTRTMLASPTQKWEHVMRPTGQAPRHLKRGRARPGQGSTAAGGWANSKAFQAAIDASQHYMSS